MTKTVLIESATGLVQNVVLLGDDAASFVPAEGATAIDVADDALVGPGMIWDGQIFSAPPPPVPEEITMRQARLALLGVGLLHTVDAALAALPSPTKEAAMIEWEYSSTVKRGSPLIAQLGPALGLSDVQIDDLFRAGAAL